jgi:hypothetical protein
VVKRRLRIVLVTVAALYGLAVIVLFFAQRRLIYHPGPPLPPRLDHATLIEKHTASGLPLVALHLEGAQGAPTVVYFHGNAEQLADLVPRLRRLHAAGLGVFAIEYPGFGLAAGSPSETAIHAVAAAAIDELERGGVPNGRIVLLGQSLGTGVAARLAAAGRGCRLILVSPFTSMAAMAGRTVPLPGVGWLVRDRFDILSLAPEIQQPTLILHGDADEIVPYAMGERLREALPHVTLGTVKGGHHNDLWDKPLEEVIAEHASPCRADRP